MNEFVCICKHVVSIRNHPKKHYGYQCLAEYIFNSKVQLNQSTFKLSTNSVQNNATQNMVL